MSFGGGKQDKWMYQNIDDLNRGIMIGIGAAFKFYIGRIKTPPRMLQHLGLQRLFRMIIDPISKGRSQMVSFPRFMVHFPWEEMKARKMLRTNHHEISFH